MEKKSNFGLGVLTGLAISLCISALSFATVKGISVIRNKQAVSPSTETKTEYTLVTDETGSSIAERESTDYESIINDETIEKMKSILHCLDEYYYLTPITDEEMEEGIYAGIVNALGDPYSVYYTEEELTKLLDDTAGVYYGIGAYVSIDTATGLPKISGVIEDTPAEACGLRSDDLIYAVDDMEVYGYELNDAVDLIRGEEGTQVELTIIREDETDYLHFTVTRAKVESPTVKYEMKENGIAYIQITQFESITTKQWEEAVSQAKKDGMEKLILDLRDNPGGSLSTVVSIADSILPEGIVCYTEDKKGKKETEKSDADCMEIPMVVLVNGNSASASEILSGAIKDYEWGTLIGTTTYGKGIVQQIIPFTDGTGIKVTISSYFTPNGTNIHGTGIEPDIVLELDKDAYYAEERVDNQLEAAIDYLQGE